MSGGPPRQIPIALPALERRDRAEFVPAPSNRLALDLVESWPDWPSATAVISGPPGSGKSHLLEIWRAWSGARLIPASALCRLDPLAAGEGHLAVDDVAPGVFDERALFHLLNAARERGGTLLLACPKPPAALSFSLPDLESRLRAAAHAGIGAPDDDLIEAVLAKLFADRQISVEPEVIRYMSLRMERSLAAARDLVARLDSESLAASRPITRALAARILGERQAAEPVLSGIDD